MREKLQAAASSTEEVTDEDEELVKNVSRLFVRKNAHPLRSATTTAAG